MASVWVIYQERGQVVNVVMLSIPEDLLDGIDDIISFIYLLLVKLKENCSHMGC